MSRHIKNASCQTGLGITLALLALAGCTPPAQAPLPPLGGSLTDQLATPRINGTIEQSQSNRPIVVFGNRPGADARQAVDLGGGQYSLDFADTDIREVVAQVLGTMLRLNYEIDPAVKGTVTLHTTQPLRAAQLMPALQTMLGSVGAAIVQAEALYRIVPAAAAGGAGSLVIPLRYVSAEELAKVLQPIAGTSTKIGAEDALNALLISGDPGQVQSLAELVRSFDVDALAGQSYAVLPVTSGSSKDFADALQEAFRGKAGGGLAGLVRVVPLARLNAVLIVSTQRGYIEAARRVFNLIDTQRRATTRSWEAFYLQNSNANDMAYTLQSAFTPNHVTAVPEAAMQGARATTGSSGGSSAAGGLGSSLGAGGAGGINGGGLNGGGGTTGGSSALGGSISGANPLAGGGANRGGGSVLAQQSGAPANNPLLGGLDQSGGASADDNTDMMRILPNAQNNAILIYGTAREQATVTAMLHKIDILPMQVRIDATIAEVTLNDALQYGTQFFFKSGGINGILSTATTAPAALASAALGVNVPGFILGSPSAGSAGGAPFAISALQAVTTVNVLSSPQLTVIDNQPARLQVGSLVPYLTASSQSTLTTNAPVINSIGYQPTGVIMEVTPRVNSGGAVTLDVSQEVSDVDTTVASTTGINSPTFTERSITSRIVVQDGQTIGLAGLIRDSVSRGNQGLPWLKDVPILGFLAGSQTNTRQRTELLVLITPHVIRSQNDARALTEDMRDALRNAAAVPMNTNNLKPSGSDDPGRWIREDLSRKLTP